MELQAQTEAFFRWLKNYKKIDNIDLLCAMENYYDEYIEFTEKCICFECGEKFNTKHELYLHHHYDSCG